jgi:XTP/dITP diphosphohydrolase
VHLLETAANAAALTGLPALADDSGIEVDALLGRPGLHSARYVSGNGWENLRAVLMETLSVPYPKRTCRMRAVVVLALPDGETIEAEGVVEGHLASFPRGQRGRYGR